MLWIIAAGSGLGLVLLWSLIEPKPGARRSLFRGVSPATGMARAGLFLVLTIALHGAIDPDHDHHAFAVHAPQIARIAYAFAVTSAFLLSFPTLRVHWGAAIVAASVLGMQTLQWLGVLPGDFRLADFFMPMIGVAAAAGPMWIGAYRARRNVAKEINGELDADSLGPFPAARLRRL